MFDRGLIDHPDGGRNPFYDTDYIDNGRHLFDKWWNGGWAIGTADDGEAWDERDARSLFANEAQAKEALTDYPHDFLTGAQVYQVPGAGVGGVCVCVRAYGDGYEADPYKPGTRCIGYLYALADEVKAEWGNNEDSITKGEQYLTGLIQEYSSWASGDV